MKQLIQPLGFSLLMMILLTSCLKDKNEAQTTTITEGSKWGITIGSTPEEVFQALQGLNQEKDGKIGYVAYYGQHAFNTPEEIVGRYLYYNALSLQAPQSVLNGVIILYDEIRVTSIEIVGPTMDDEVENWPEDVSDEMIIHKGDGIETMFQKVSAIHELSGYNSYQIVLPEKTLLKDFDPELANLEHWSFSFEESMPSGKTGMNNVVLSFSSKKLTTISISYIE